MQRNRGADCHNDLSMVVETARHDRSSLLYAMKRMRDQLTSTMSAIKVSADSIATASSQIAAGNLELSQRTEEQAASLEQTAASMEQLTSTVTQHSDNAKHANILASRRTKESCHRPTPAPRGRSLARSSWTMKSAGKWYTSSMSNDRPQSHVRSSFLI